MVLTKTLLSGLLFRLIELDHCQRVSRFGRMGRGTRAGAIDLHFLSAFVAVGSLQGEFHNLIVVFGLAVDDLPVRQAV